MRLSIFAALVVIFGSLTGCSRNPRSAPSPRPQGVNVGNGLVGKEARLATYSSPHHYAVRYPETLKIEHTRDHVKAVIDNTPLLEASPGARVSRIEFRVSPPTAGRSAVSDSPDINEQRLALREHARRFYPSLSFRDVDFPGAKGIKWEELTPDRLGAKYLIITRTFTLIEIDVDSYPEGNGIRWVAPIVDTFVHDINAPVLHELKLDPAVVDAGGGGRLLFRATDDVSGIADSRTRCAGFVLAGAKGATARAQTVSVCGPVRNVGDDWYAINFWVNQFRVAGDYLLESFDIADSADNSVVLRKDESHPTHYRESRGGVARATGIPLLSLRVRNAAESADTTAPMIREMQVVPARVKAGEKARLRFRATDDVSGIADLGEQCAAFVPADASGSPRTNLSISSCDAAVRKGEDWYELEFTVNPYRPSGDYVLGDFDITDNAGNVRYFSLGRDREGRPETHFRERVDGEPTLGAISVPKLSVLNETGADVTPPVIHEMEVFPKQVVPGQRAELRFRATDDFSGVEGFRGTCTGLVPADLPPDRRHDASIDTCGVVRTLGDQWYAIDILVNRFRPSGDYYLESFSIGDRAGNRTEIRTDLSPTGIPKESFLILDDRDIPRLSTLAVPRLKVGL